MRSRGAGLYPLLCMNGSLGSRMFLMRDGGLSTDIWYPRASIVLKNVSTLLPSHIIIVGSLFFTIINIQALLIQLECDSCLYKEKTNT